MTNGPVFRLRDIKSRTPDQPCQGVLTEENRRGTFQLLNLNNGKNSMKTTIEIHDDLLARAKQYAKKTGRTSVLHPA